MASLRLRILHNHLHDDDLTLTPTSGQSAAAQAVLATRKQIPILESYMSYLDTGATSPNNKTVIFLHGNPTAAYLWRNVIPHVQEVARCLAPDLIGMGHSGKEPNYQYRFRDHYKYLSAWIDKMNFTIKLNFVIHDWGSALGFHWANQHRDRVESITFMEGSTAVSPNWDSFPPVARRPFQNLRSSGGEEMVLKKNFFLERMLPGSIMRKLTDEEMDEYRRPFKEPGESRRPTLTFPREVPIRSDGPADVVAIADAYIAWLRRDASLPKLFVDADPGFFSTGMRKRFEQDPWPNMKSVKSAGLHFPQEDSPDTIGKAVCDFLSNDIFPESNVSIQG